MFSFKNILFAIISVILLFLSIAAARNYAGHVLYYVLFSLIFNYAFLKALFRPKFYFETFLYGLLWLGFWLKFTYRTVLHNYYFVEATGNFDFSGASLDRVLIIATSALFACVVTIEIISRFVKSNTMRFEDRTFPTLNFYKKNWALIWTLFVLLTLIVGIFNNYYGIYLRGLVPETKLFSPIRNIIVWLLLSGLACVAVTFLYWEILIKRFIFSTLLLSLLESLITNTSILSRAFIINTGSHLWAFLQQKSYLRKLGIKKIIILGTVFSIMFGSSVIFVGYLRYARYPATKVNPIFQDENYLKAQAFVSANSYSLFIDRWVGLEGLMSVASYPHLGWDLLHTAWNEKMDDKKHGFYDSEIAKSSYIVYKLTTQHFITLPGIIAFLFYSGSLVFLTLMLSLICTVFITIELALKKYIGNPFLTALFAQSAAFKLLHFGYAPHQFWKYFLAFIITLFCIYGIQEFKNKKVAES